MLFVETKKALRIPVLGEWSQKCVHAEKMSLSLTKEGCSLFIQYLDGAMTSFYGMTYSVTMGNCKDSIRFYGMEAPEFEGRHEFYFDVKNDELILTDKKDENFEMVFSRVWK
jgi:hypothetical protein